jgi:hypothetical protein
LGTQRKGKERNDTQKGAMLQRLNALQSPPFLSQNYCSLKNASKYTKTFPRVPYVVGIRYKVHMFQECLHIGLRY